MGGGGGGGGRGGGGLGGGAWGVGRTKSTCRAGAARSALTLII